MRKPEDYSGMKTAWCPGCGNFGILRAFKQAMAELDVAPHRLCVVSGIGQAGKFPHYVRCNTFNSLHGRALPVATGIRLSNHEMLVIAVGGDGDMYGEGGNHLLHTIRRNINITLFVHNNQIYGLTKGQGSPTTAEGLVTKTQPFGVLSEQLNPMALAVALDAGFAARSFSGDTEHLVGMMKAAINHKGFALLDILQPCVSFNKVNTYAWYKERVYHIEPGYDPDDRVPAFARALEWGEKIPLGVIYRNTRPALEEKIPIISETPLVHQAPELSRLKETLKEFY